MEREFVIKIYYEESDNGISVQMDTDGLSPYTIMGIFEHFSDQIKRRVGGSTSSEMSLPNQKN